MVIVESAMASVMEGESSRTETVEENACPNEGVGVQDPVGHPVVQQDVPTQAADDDDDEGNAGTMGVDQGEEDEAIVHQMELDDEEY